MIRGKDAGGAGGGPTAVSEAGAGPARRNHPHVIGIRVARAAREARSTITVLPQARKHGITVKVKNVAGYSPVKTVVAHDEISFALPIEVFEVCKEDDHRGQGRRLPAPKAV